MAIVLPCDIALVLGGGNALGAYQAGAYQALADAGIVPDRIVGASIGAINGALVAGNAPADRLSRLTDFWRPAPVAQAGTDWLAVPDGWRRTGEVLGTLLGGRAGMFSPPGATLPGGRPALYDTAPLMRTLTHLIDFDRLNSGTVRYTATAVALDTGEDAMFEAGACRVTAAHICASGSLPPSFPPVTIDGVRYVDGGLSANLPLDPVLANPGNRPLWCIALDLLPLAAHNPGTLGGMAERAQDLTFAIQSRRSIMRWNERYATDPAFAQRAVTLSLLTYADQQPEVAGKAMDFSPASVRRRWDAGHRDASALVARWRQGALPIGERGLHLG